MSTPDSKYSKTFSNSPALAALKNAVLGSLCKQKRNRFSLFYKISSSQISKSQNKIVLRTKISKITCENKIDFLYLAIKAYFFIEDFSDK